MELIALANAEFEGNNSVYLFDDAVTTLVDTGVSRPTSRAALESGLADDGVGFADLDLVLLTHWHADHVGLAGAIQAASGATVRASTVDGPLAGREPDAWDEYERRQRRAFDAWGMPESPREDLLAFLEGSSGVMGEPADIDPFEAGETLDLGETTLRTVALPGHTAGQTGFAFEAGGETHLLAGDALLPRYTPNVGGADVRVDRPLATYLETLSRIAEAGYDRAFPGHRDPIADPAGRAREIADHHRDRARRVLTVLDERGPADPWTVSATLFGDLAGIHIMHGPGEAAAHLTHLADDGLVESAPDGYRLTAAGTAVLDDADADPLGAVFQGHEA